MIFVMIALMFSFNCSKRRKKKFLLVKEKNFSDFFLNPNIFSSLNSNCSDILYLRNIQEQVEKEFCYQKLFRPFTINCSNDLKNLASNVKNFLDHQNKFFSQYVRTILVTKYQTRLQKDFGSIVLSSLIFFCLGSSFCHYDVCIFNEFAGSQLSYDYTQLLRAV